MLRSVGSKVAWVGRTASMVFGLALVLALVVGVASAAFGANGQAWILGQSNVATAITKLAGTAGVDGPMLQLINNNKGTNDTALALNVQSGEAPMRVNSTRKVANLNADLLDGKESVDFAPSAHSHDDRYLTESESDSRYLGRNLQVRAHDVTTPANTNGSASVNCQAGEQATGGGVALMSGNAKNIFYFEPGGIPIVSSSGVVGWKSSWYAETHQATVRVYAVCAP